MSATPEEREAKQRSALIDRQIRSDLREYENTIKILLLGKNRGTVLQGCQLIMVDLAMSAPW